MTIEHHDISFNVPFVHRLRFTQDVLGDDADTLLSLLESTTDQPARVQIWLDESLLKAQPGIRERCERLFDANPRRLIRASNIQSAPGGEEVKNDIHVLERMLKVMNAADLDRRSYVVIIGGGAVLDAVGFAAAIAHRGIRVIRIPSTTLAQADSGVGVKNGVNLFGKKNWIGSFAVPWGVINDAHLLQSLSQRDYICGFAEAVKVALLKDSPFFEQIESSTAAIKNRDATVAQQIIERSARWHLDHITRGGDPFESLEARPLDFGHWSAHKLESMTEFRLRHGEAVAVGLAIDVIYSSAVHQLPVADARRVLRVLSQLGFTFDAMESVDSSRLLMGLEEFRQHLGGRLTLTMLDGIGRPIDVHEVDEQKMVEAIESIARFHPSVTPVEK